jgi:hypothetical protein
MSTRSKKEYPFKVITVIPKVLSKKKDVIRTSYYKTRELAQKDVDAWHEAGFSSKIYDR